MEGTGTATQIISKLGQIEHTVAIDLFYYRASLINDSVLPIFTDLNKLRELILYPMLNPTEFLDEIKSVTCMSLEVLQLGIINLNIQQLRRILSEVFNSFPKIETLNLKINNISEKGIELSNKLNGKHFVPLNVSELA